MNWNVAKAKERLAELIRGTAREPQRIYNRDRLVAVVVRPEDFEAFEVWRARQTRSLEEDFQELRAICREEGYELIVPERQDRPNPFAEALDVADGAD